MSEQTYRAVVQTLRSEEQTVTCQVGPLTFQAVAVEVTHLGKTHVSLNKGLEIRLHTVGVPVENRPTADVEAAFRAGFKAGFDVTREGFNGECPYPHCSRNPYGLPWQDDDVDKFIQDVEDAAFKAAYPEQGEEHRG